MTHTGGSNFLARMILLKVIEDLPRLDDEVIIYARKPWSPSSVATTITIEEDEAGDGRSGHLEGFEYFLEVFVAREFLDGWSESWHSPVSNYDQCMRLIKYAENDA
jgi:hypothetical protein